MPGVDRDLLALHLRNKVDDEQLSIRRAAALAGCSAATLSRLMSGSESGYTPDTATLGAVASWLGKRISDFESTEQPLGATPAAVPVSTTFSEVEVHLNALPDITKEDAQAMMAAIKAWYETKRDGSPESKQT